MSLFNLKNVFILFTIGLFIWLLFAFINKSWGNYDWDNGDDNQTTICHCEVPDGQASPDQCQTLTIGEEAAEYHLDEHENDYEGACQEDLSLTPTPEEITPTPTTEPITPSPTETPIVVQRSENGGGSGDGRSDGHTESLGCQHPSDNCGIMPTLVPCSANNCGWK